MQVSTLGLASNLASVRQLNMTKQVQLHLTRSWPSWWTMEDEQKIHNYSLHHDHEKGCKEAIKGAGQTGFLSIKMCILLLPPCGCQWEATETMCDWSATYCLVYGIFFFFKCNTVVCKRSHQVEVMENILVRDKHDILMPIFFVYYEYDSWNRCPVWVYTKTQDTHTVILALLELPHQGHQFHTGHCRWKTTDRSTHNQVGFL